MIAIHAQGEGFTERWIQYCNSNKIEFILVNLYDSNIIDFLRENKVQILFAHLDLNDYKIKIISKTILMAIEKSGIKVYPDFTTFCHYDDKISQKYIFEAFKIPYAKMHVFYSKDDAENWLSNASFPLVFKLRGGSASSNVILVKGINEAKSLLNKMFGKGIKPMRSVLYDFKTKMRSHRNKRDWAATFKRLPDIILSNLSANSILPRERGYYLVQDFMPGNSYDTRIVIVGDKAFAFRRFNRPNDFKASGSKNVDLIKENVDKRAIALAFEAAHKIGSQSMAFDVIFNLKNEPVFIEMSYVCPVETIYETGGYWDSSLEYHNAPIWMEEEIIKQVIETNTK
jgi:glutathione synthase/RimK-type ligase-like ATP-grasp enzyme